VFSTVSDQENHRANSDMSIVPNVPILQDRSITWALLTVVFILLELIFHALVKTASNDNYFMAFHHCLWAGASTLKNGLVTSLKDVLTALMDGLEVCLGTSGQPADVGQQPASPPPPYLVSTWTIQCIFPCLLTPVCSFSHIPISTPFSGSRQ
jgi:hypothetical protein